MNAGECSPHAGMISGGGVNSVATRVRSGERYESGVFTPNGEENGGRRRLADSGRVDEDLGIELFGGAWVN